MTKRNYFFINAIVLISCIAIGCGSAKNLMGDSNRHTYRLGVSNINTMKIETPRIFNRFGFVVQRQEEALSDVYFESRWLKRPPLEDEVKIGIKQANVRLIVRATPRATAGSQGHIYKVTLTSETQYQSSETGEWKASPPTEMAIERIEEIADAFKTEFQVKGLN